MIYIECIMHENSQKKAENKYIEPIYTGLRILLGIYSPNIHIYSDLSACAQSEAQYVYVQV